MRKLRRNSLLSLVILFFIAIPIAMFASQVLPQFTNPIPYDAGGSPSSVAVGDVNGDGHLDLVVSYWADGAVGVLLGNGDGTFKPVVKYGSGDSHSYAVAVADVNGDGKLDIVVLNTFDQPGTVGVLLGNDDGTFQPAVTYYTGDYSMPESLAVGDLNGDGYPDIAVANFGHSDCDCNDGRIGLLWNKGDGRFQPIVFHASGGYDTVFIMIKDGGTLVTNLCGDRYCDWPNGTVCWGGQCYDSGGIDPYSAALGDMNRDDYFDIVVANSQGNGIYNPPSVGVLLNEYDGDFKKAVVYDASGKPSAVAVADINGDGKLDVVVNYWSGSGIGVLLGRGAGTLRAAVKFGSVGTGLVVADLNGDTKPDLIGTSAVLLNTTPFITTTSLTSSLNPSFVGQAVSFTATVKSNHGSIPDGELVTFYDNTKVLTSAALAGGVATYTTPSLSGKTHTIKAYYPGDGAFAVSNASVKQQVLKYTTNTSLSSSPNPSSYGQAVTFTATVTTSGPYAVTGRVKFYDGATAIGHAPLTGGVASIKKSTLAVGTHAITAQYLSDSYNDNSTSEVVNQVVQ
jgi:hypothetical protein